MARDIENITLELPGESDTIQLNVDGEETTVKLSLDSWIGADNELSETSLNAVQNRVVTAELNAKQDTLTAGANITIANNVISATGAVESVNGKTGAVALSASDVGALSDDTTMVSSFNGQTGAVTYAAPVSSVNGQTGAVTVNVPTALSELTNDANYVRDASYVHTDSNFTASEKTKLAGVSAGAEVNVQANWTEADSANDAFIKNKPTKLSAFNNDAGYLTGVNWGQISGTIANQTDLQEALDNVQGGHVILTPSGSSMTQRKNLKFVGATVTDDSGTDTTIVSGLKGDKGDTGATGTAATISVGAVTSGTTPNVTNVGTSSAAVFDFVLPKGNKGDKGEKGDTGATGATGAPGATGPAGQAATIRVGTVVSGTSASVTNSGTSSAAVFDFVLPKGERGRDGADGAPGTPGTSASIRVGNVTKGETASVTNTGTSSAAVFDFVLPKGDKGNTGEAGTAATVAVGNVSSGASASVVNSGTSTAAVLDFVLPKGDAGETGPAGNGITSITKTGTQGLVDTYTISYTNSPSTTFTVTNGEDGQDGRDGQDVAASTVATVESTSTASKSYATGDYLVYTGILYKVIADISSGQTLTPGTNISATTAGAELKSLNNGLASVNIASVTRITTTATTGSTGNIALPYSNDGKKYVVAPFALQNAFLRAWVAQANNSWYLTAVNPNTGATINNTTLDIRYLMIVLKSI